MTYYELIRTCLTEDAEKHPYPKKDDGLSLLALLLKSHKPEDDESET